jgi:glyoxylase-like metal-dependent hydrolase (beta-lactamase superfamily II)
MAGFANRCLSASIAFPNLSQSPCCMAFWASPNCSRAWSTSNWPVVAFAAVLVICAVRAPWGCGVPKRALRASSSVGSMTTLSPATAMTRLSCGKFVPSALRYKGTTYRNEFSIGVDAIDLHIDGSDFDHLFKDGERFNIGKLDVQVIYTPGHTPADITYKIEDAAFVGDTLFMPDYGTARADFPGGDAHQLYRPIRKLLELPPETRLFMCHDYKAPGRDIYAWETTVREERERNVQIKEGVSEDAFVTMRNARDATLSAPRLLLPSIQVNIRAGKFPPAHANGVRYLTIPVKFKNAEAVH